MPAIFVPVIYFIVVLAHAYIDYYKIKVKGKYINHKTESVYFILICIALFFLLYKFSGISALPLILFPLLTRAAFFDPLLNWFRGLPFIYEGVKKKTRDKSFFDNLEQTIGWPVWVYRVVYFLLYAIWMGIYIWQY